MRILLRSVMHKMRKVLDSKCERLLYRCFFYEKNWLVFLLSLFFCFGVTNNVYADGNGNLTLNPNIIINDDTQIGSSGDFLIRRQLFSDKLNQTSKNNRKAQENLIKQAEKIDFENRNINYQEKFVIPKNLFQNYQPQVIPSKENSTSSNSQPTILIYIFGGVILLIMGSFVGRNWARRQK